MRVAPFLFVKSILRKQLRAARRALHSAEHLSASLAAQRAVMRSPAFAAGKNVAMYLPFDGETATAVLIEAARNRGIRIFLPVIADRRHARLRFSRFEGELRPGRHGIPIPASSHRCIGARFLNLIVVPLVGVDPAGRRLGMGGGYYDRALAFRKCRRSWTGPRLVGLAFDRQRTNANFADSWDLQLDCLGTETGLHHF